MDENAVSPAQVSHPVVIRSTALSDVAGETDYDALELE
jgi:hypothetical protein